MTVKAIRGTEAKTAAKWSSGGWELHSQRTGTIRTEMRFRRPQPKSIGAFLSGLLASIRQLSPRTQRAVLAGAGGVAVLVVVGIALAAGSGGESPADSDAPTTVEASPSEPVAEESEGPSQDPFETPSASQSEPVNPVKPVKAPAATDVEVVDAFQAFLGERAAAGVVIAQAATDVAFSDRVLVVTFDPAAVGMDQRTFDSINAFNNPYDKTESLADFVAAPISSNDAAGIRLRRAIDKVVAVYADGDVDGSRTTDEIVKLNGLG